MSFINISKGISRIRLVTIPITRAVHWLKCPDNMRRPIPCSYFNCILCQDLIPKYKLRSCIGYDYNRQGIVEMLSAVYNEWTHIKYDSRLYDLKIEKIANGKCRIDKISEEKRPIKPTADMMLELSNLLVPLHSKDVEELVFNLDPGFKPSKLSYYKNNKNLIDTIKAAIDSLKEYGIVPSSADYINNNSSSVRLVMPNKVNIAVSIFVARKIGDELYTHNGHFNDIKDIINPGNTPFYSYEYKQYGLLINEDGDFKFKPDIANLAKQIKFMGILS